MKKWRENDVEKTPAEPSKSEENHWFYCIPAKMTKKKTYENICKNYENSKRPKPYKTCRFLVFSIEKTRLQRRSRDARALTSRNRFSFKNRTKVDFLIKPNIKKTSKTINGHQIMSITVPRFYSFWLPRNHKRLDAFSPYKRRNHYKTRRVLRFIRNDPRRKKLNTAFTEYKKPKRLLVFQWKTAATR